MLRTREGWDGGAVGCIIIREGCCCRGRKKTHLPDEIVKCHDRACDIERSVECISEVGLESVERRFVMHTESLLLVWFLAIRISMEARRDGKRKETYPRRCR